MEDCDNRNQEDHVHRAPIQTNNVNDNNVQDSDARSVPQAQDGLRNEDVGDETSLCVIRNLAPDSMAEGEDATVAEKDRRQKTTSRVHELTALYAAPPSDSVSDPACPGVICEEFLKVLGRTEVEQPMICWKLCACAQFWRYLHYFLPLWDWGVDKMICFGLGSFRNVRGGGDQKMQVSYREMIRNPELLKTFNSRKVVRHDPLQVMLRHIAAIEMASILKFCSSKRGVEHQLIKTYFTKLTIIQDMLGHPEKSKEKAFKKLNSLPPTAGYAGDKDLMDIPVYLHDPEYTEEDKHALEQLSEMFKMAHLPPVRVVDASEAYLLVDRRTLVYTVDPDFPVRSTVLGTSSPGVMIWRDRRMSPVSGDFLTDDVLPLLDNYEEFKLDRASAPHTIGLSNVYIRSDIVKEAERHQIIPPYPVTFPHEHKHDNWYLDRVRKRKGMD